MIKILHCADVHIDSPFAGVGAKEAAARREQLLSAFSKTVETARYTGVELFLIAGDFFDSRYIGFDTVARLSREMASLPACRFVIACGNHDPYTEKGPYAASVWPSNVYIFRSESVEKFSFDDLNTDVYGYSFTSPALRACPLEGFAPDDPSKINVVVAHGDLDVPVSDYCPIRSKLLDALDVDYVALGHIHKGAVGYAGEKYAYSGCLAGRALDETGKKGFIAGTLSKGKRDLHFIRLDGKHFETASLDVTDLADDDALRGAVRSLVASFDADTTLRLTLHGRLSGAVASVPQSAEFTGLVDRLEIRDETVPGATFDELSRDVTIRGAAFAKLLPYLESDDAAEREKGKLALKYTLAALSGGSLS